MTESRDSSRAVASVVFVASAAVLLSVVPGDAGFRDAGELGAASYVLGVAHPTGFPLDMLIMRAGATVPLGSVALRQNATVALVASLALALFALLVVRLARRVGCRDAAAAMAGAVVAVVGLGTWATFLASAVLVEVYATSLALVALAAVGAMDGSSRGRALVWLALGLSLGAHVTARVCIAPLALCALASAPTGSRARSLLPAVGLFVVGALSVVYLPLASLRGAPLNWGDPQTPGRLLDHLTAAGLRETFGSRMLRPSGEATSTLLAQLAELWPLSPALLLGGAVLLVRARRVALVVLSVGVLDLLYATRVNPMGVDDRQVGHTVGAVVVLVAGVGVATAVGSLSRGKGGRMAGRALAALLASALVVCAPVEWLCDASAATELVGSGGALERFPPRALGLCATDDACAGALFALYVDDVRPDVVVAPGRRLWDPVVLRSLLGHEPSLGRFVRESVPVGEREQLAREAARTLLVDRVRAPVLVESGEIFGEDLARSSPTALVGWARPSARGSEPEALRGPPPDWLAVVDAAARARGMSQPTAPWAAQAWAHVHDSLARAALDSGDPWLATRSWARAVALAPERAPLWTNYAVALAAVGDLPGAIAASERAIVLGPSHATAWVNLARYLVAHGERDRAARALAGARSLGMHDRRLDRLAAELGAP